MIIDPPYLIFLGDVPDTLAAKTGLGIVDLNQTASGKLGAVQYRR